MIAQEIREICMWEYYTPFFSLHFLQKSLHCMFSQLSVFHALSKYIFRFFFWLMVRFIKNKSLEEPKASFLQHVLFRNLIIYICSLFGHSDTIEKHPHPQSFWLPHNLKIWLPVYVLNKWKKMDFIGNKFKND
jgi:hypothetical protein